MEGAPNPGQGGVGRAGVSRRKSLITTGRYNPQGCGMLDSGGSRCQASLKLGRAYRCVWCGAIKFAYWNMVSEMNRNGPSRVAPSFGNARPAHAWARRLSGLSFPSARAPCDPSRGRPRSRSRPGRSSKTKIPGPCFLVRPAQFGCFGRLTKQRRANFPQPTGRFVAAARFALTEFRALD
jgi:hypothetical protein